MSVRLKPTSQIKARLGINQGGRVQQHLTNTVHRYMDKYVPYDEGFLRTNVEAGKDYVLYKSPYAHYQYKGILFVDPKTGSSYARRDVTKVPTSRELIHHTTGTGSYWDKKMMSAEGDKMIAEVQRYIDRGAK